MQLPYFYTKILYEALTFFFDTFPNYCNCHRLDSLLNFYVKNMKNNRPI